MNKNFVLLVGGVGGAKLAVGLAELLPADRLTVIGNTGDDFIHLGLPISPDLDTVMYNLAGVANPQTGWGRADESWRAMEVAQTLGAPSWFNLGDTDLATHLTRAHLLANGATLTAVTSHLCRHLHIPHPLLPMSDQPAPTTMHTDEGIFPFQEWFVQKKWQPTVKKIELPANIHATNLVLQALEQADVLIIAPSNPFVSIDPILNVYPIRAMVEDMPALVVAVSPIIGGQAVKGPAGKMMGELGMPVSAEGIAQYYDELVDLFVYDRQDAGITLPSHQSHLVTDIWIKNQADKKRLAQEILTEVGKILA